MPSLKEANARFHKYYATKFLMGKETKEDMPHIANAAQLEPTFGPIDIEAVERNLSTNPEEKIKGQVVLRKNQII